ncbi:trypsin-like peptidase domain-containing protein [Pseudonocardia nematodicida]|uniref:Trypsin-like peptidase domain-containing protein n=1 Tax=Pseudonocardia nematodicida TaxID=1206997 RepID=A0ABV1KEG8_9PSEU
MDIRKWSAASVTTVLTVAMTCALWTTGAPQGSRVVGLGSVAPWGPADPRSPSLQPPVRGQAGPIVGGLSSSSVGVLVVDGGRHRCSATVIASDSRRLLATAAHCVWLEGDWRVDGAFFIPGFAAGEEPYGRWSVDTAYVSPAWQDANSPISDVAANLDYAFVSLLPRDGVLPEQVLGAQGIRFTDPAAGEAAALGYPAAGVYDGGSLRGCTGPAAIEPFARTPELPGEILALDCDMTQGASGGPWLAGPDASSGRGQVIGVVSGGDDTALVSPRFGPEVEQVYAAADTAAQATDPSPGRAADPMSAQIAPRGGSS